MKNNNYKIIGPKENHFCIRKICKTKHVRNMVKIFSRMPEATLRKIHKQICKTLEKFVIQMPNSNAFFVLQCPLRQKLLARERVIEFVVRLKQKNKDPVLFYEKHRNRM